MNLLLVSQVDLERTEEGDDYFQFDRFSDKFEREIDCWQEVKEVILCKSG